MRIFKIVFIAAVIFGSCNNNRFDKIPGSAELLPLISPADDSSSVPYLFTDKKGVVHLSWVERNGKNAFFKLSSLINDKWSDAITIANGNNWFVNWADYPTICADGNNNMIAHYLEKSDTGKFTYDVKYVVSSDNGKSWNAPRILNDDGKLAEHGFVSIQPFGENYFVSWLDGRNAAMEGGHSGHDGHHGEMTIRGAIIKKDGAKLNDQEMDSRVCDCCQTSVAITANGPIVVYRDRSAEEIRDISIVRFINGQWTTPQTIFPDNWMINACPVNGPRADAIGNHLTIAWFTMADKKGQVHVIFSDDGGATFKKPIRVDKGNPIGRVGMVMINEKTAVVSWMEGSDIKAVKVKADGTQEKSVMIASSSESRSSGFPQMAKSGSRLVFAWTDSKEKTIKTSVLTY